MNCRFIDDYGSFVAEEPLVRDAYFPLCNQSLMAGITPFLDGDLKIDQEHFFLPPVSRINLTNDKTSVNLWLRFPKGLYSVVGKSSTHLNHLWPVKLRVEAGIGWFTVFFDSVELGLTGTITSFVDYRIDAQIFWVKIKSLARKSLGFEPIFVAPVYARSADNIRDHRHVTSLLNRVRLFSNGLAVKPTMSFDERGHRINDVVYCAFADRQLKDIFASYEDVVGSGDMLNPVGLLKAEADNKNIQGKEVIAGLVFPEVRLKKGDSVEFAVALFIGRGGQEAEFSRFIRRMNPKTALRRTRRVWIDYVNTLRFRFPESDFSNWLMWVGVQPYLRKIYGCSFLPDFDYGRGGRGWRDLWQDLLGLLLRNPEEARQDILNNFNGVRIDGSNATIIGKGKGEFIADRNKITRVWMDHGVWPWETTKLYIDQTGDWRILFERATYFRDAQIFRARRYDYNWNGETVFKTADNKVYKGTILEHILLQHLVQVFNVGDNGNILLEDADWNDGLDMARERGESVAFTHFYAGNLLEIAQLLERISDDVREVALLREMAYLLELPSSVSEKRRLLNSYFEAVQSRGVSGEQMSIETRELADILRKKAQDMRRHLLKKELIEIEGHRLFNGYYDNLGHRVCGVRDGLVRATLTGQVFALMKGTVDKALAKEISLSVDKFLLDEELKGYRLNTDFGDIYPELGRAFAFAFGEKENGAIFSHMVVMYANALFRQGLVKEAAKALLSLYKLAMDFEKSRSFPCLSEYYNNEGRGMYSYLTGSASWYILTIYRYVLGIASDLGDVVFEPRLSREFFQNGDTIEVDCLLLGKKMCIKIKNKDGLDWGQYVIRYVKIGGKRIPGGSGRVVISRKNFEYMIKGKKRVTVEVVLGCAE